MSVNSCSLEIQQRINELRIDFNNCKQPSHKELIDILDLISDVMDCQGGGNYNTLVQETYTEEGEITFGLDSFHSFSINVMEGSMEYGGVNFPAGTTRNVEYSTLNQSVVKFKVNSNSKVFIEYLK